MIAKSFLRLVSIPKSTSLVVYANVRTVLFGLKERDFEPHVRYYQDHLKIEEVISNDLDLLEFIEVRIIVFTSACYHQSFSFAN